MRLPGLPTEVQRFSCDFKLKKWQLKRHLNIDHTSYSFHLASAELIFLERLQVL